MTIGNAEFMGGDCGNPEATIVGLNIPKPYDRVFLDDTEPIPALTPEAQANKDVVDRFTEAKTDYVFGRINWQAFSAIAEQTKRTFSEHPNILARIQEITEDLRLTYEVGVV